MFKDDIPDITHNGYAITADELDEYLEVLQEVNETGSLDRLKVFKLYLDDKYGYQAEFPLIPKPLN
ncbi:hypothetical protein [Priestia aryabhattai]|uniref:hypothetical protein n=1 Tax=Priestia aryabhattai TaxID=412384 RepID=UPI0015F6F006|nr:hypothetical protein [Priestia aryabhattai]